MTVHKRTSAIASAVLLSTLVSGAAFAKAVPPVGPKLGVTATVTHVTSHTVSFKEKAPGIDKTVTLSTNQISHVSEGLQKSARLSHITVGERVILQSTQKGWVVTLQPAPPMVGTIEHIGASTLTLTIMGGPGQSGKTRTISLSGSVQVQSGPSQAQSLTSLKIGESVMVQTTSDGLTITVMPIPPQTGKIVHLTNDHVTIQMRGPGQTGETTYSLSGKVVVSAGPHHKNSLAHLKIGELVSIQKSSTQLTIHLLPLPPQTLHQTPMEAPKIPHTPQAPHPKTLPNKP